MFRCGNLETTIRFLLNIGCPTDFKVQKYFKLSRRLPFDWNVRFLEYRIFHYPPSTHITPSWAFRSGLCYNDSQQTILGWDLFNSRRVFFLKITISLLTKVSFSEKNGIGLTTFNFSFMLQYTIIFLFEWKQSLKLYLNEDLQMENIKTNLLHTVDCGLKYAILTHFKIIFVVKLLKSKQFAIQIFR